MHKERSIRDSFFNWRKQTFGQLAGALLICSLASAQPEVCFERERVTIDLTASKGCVKGEYIFYSAHSVAHQLPIFFPISVTQDCHFPEEIEVRFAGEPLAFAKGPDSKSIRFRMPIEPLSEDTLEIHYCQPLTGCDFTYITTTLHGWEYPLEEAQFEITCPSEWQLDISYPVEKTEEKGVRKTYYIYQTSFYPDEDLRIQWNKTQAKEAP